jgi:hypothetical protein
MILEGADISFIEEENPGLAESFASVDLPITIELIEIMNYLDIKDKADVEALEKVKYIYEYAKTQGDPATIIKDINCRIGFTSQRPIDRIYQYARLNSEIDTTARNLNGLLRQKSEYENNDNTSGGQGGGQL